MLNKRYSTINAKQNKYITHKINVSKPKTEENKVTQEMEEHNITFKGTIKMLHGLLQKL